MLNDYTKSFGACVSAFLNSEPLSLRTTSGGGGGGGGATTTSREKSDFHAGRIVSSKLNNLHPLGKRIDHDKYTVETTVMAASQLQCVQIDGAPWTTHSFWATQRNGTATLRVCCGTRLALLDELLAFAGHRGKVAAIGQEAAGSFPRRVTGLQMHRADDFFLHRRRNYRHRSDIMRRQLHVLLQQAINNTQLRPHFLECGYLPVLAGLQRLDHFTDSRIVRLLSSDVFQAKVVSPESRFPPLRQQRQALGQRAA